MAILGIDEVGRGPLAGPVVIGAVILPDEKPDWVADLRDSKKLSKKRREVLSEIIMREAPATGLGWVASEEIDLYGIASALRLATRRAVKSLFSLHVPFCQIIIDGNTNFLADTPLEGQVSTVIKADDLIKEVSAASIIAKVARDRYMTEMALSFPGYGFEQNAGYGTKKHIEAIHKLGICPEHRRSYEPIKSMTGFTREEAIKKNTSRVGGRGEDAVAEYLMRAGHRLVAKNFKTPLYEIDLVTTCEEYIYFTEVKTRKNADYGGGLMAVDKKKLAKMRFSAESFMKYRREFAMYSPMLAVSAVKHEEEEYTVETWFPLAD